MMAPACPIRLPGGAVTPAMKETTGLFLWLWALTHSAACSSASPPISPIMIMPIPSYPSLTLGLIVDHEPLEHINKIGSVERVSTDANADRLSESHLRRLVNCFVCESARTRDDANAAGLVDVSRHDADLARVGLDDAGAVWPNQSGLILGLQGGLHAHHVGLRNSLGDADHKTDLGLHGVEDGLGSERRGNVDHAGVAVGRALGIHHSLEHGESQMGRSSLRWGHTADHLGAVLEGLLGVEGSLWISGANLLLFRSFLGR